MSIKPVTKLAAENFIRFLACSSTTDTILIEHGVTSNWNEREAVADFLRQAADHLDPKPEVMDKYQQAIINYESRRQLIGTLIEKRMDLLEECDFYDDEYGGHAPCLSLAWKDAIDINSNNHDSMIGFSEVLFGDANEEYCESCKDSYRIKIGSLAEAKQKFGSAKRTLSIYGKQLIKEQA